MFFAFTELTYKDLLKSLPIPNEINKAEIIGKKRDTFSVVSSIITAREKESLVYPASILAEPMIAYVEGLISLIILFSMKCPTILPREHPIIIPGKKRPAGTEEP